MSRTNPLFIILFIIIFPLHLISEKWDGRIYKEDGIIVVESKGKGIWGEEIEKRILFSQTLSLGVEEGDENLIFGEKIDLAVDSEQNIYILDARNFRILKFDKNGNFLWKTGRKGQGPGEFEGPYKIKITSRNNLAVLDNFLKIHFFSLDGKYLHTLKLEKMISNIEFLKDGRMLVCPSHPGRFGYTAEFWSEDGKFLSKFPDEYFFGPKFPQHVVTGLMKGFSFSKRRLFLSLPDRYEIREYNLIGKFLRKIRRDFPLKPSEIKIKGRGIMVKTYDTSGPTFLLKNGIIVNFLEVSQGENSRKFLDFFDIEGRFLGSLKVDIYLLKVDQNDNFYFCQYEPFPQIIRKTLKVIQ